MNKKVVISITGMSCTACSSGIEKALNKTDGVSRASVNFANEKATVEYDNDVISHEDLHSIIKKLGYGIINEQISSEKRRTFSISGMSCTACAGGIEKSLTKTDGVKQASVNFANEKATIEYDDAVVKREDLYKLIEDLGYKVVTEQASDENKCNLNIKGMSCAACSAKIDKVLNN